MIDFLFQSTRPVRGATSWQSNSIIGFLISIHAPRAGRDPISTIANAVGVISIHAPRAGRDYSRRDCFHYRYISIHAPRAGRDCFSALSIAVTL